MATKSLTLIKCLFSSIKMEISTSMVALIAIVSVMGLVGVVAIDVINIIQEAEGRGCRTSQAVNASKGRCIRD